MIFGYVVGDMILNNFFLFMFPPLDLRFQDICEKLLLLLQFYLDKMYLWFSVIQSLNKDDLALALF